MDRDTTEEIKRHFNVVAESLRGEIRTVAEGVGANTDRLDQIEERLDRLEARVAEEAAETRAMIRLSFGELDRRIRSLEGDVAALRTRLERLEARTMRSEALVSTTQRDRGQMRRRSSFRAGATRMASGLTKSFFPVAEICHASASGKRAPKCITVKPSILA